MHRGWPGVAAAAVIVLLGLVPAAGALASSPIEGEWPFNGGKIKVEPVAGGGFVGNVVEETKFVKSGESTECIHPVGQQIWAHMTQLPDGSYSGYDQWYYETAAPHCKEAPELGRTAWRVMEGSSGTHYLLVCLSHPREKLSEPEPPQPTIAADGTVANATYGCVESTHSSPNSAGGSSGSKEGENKPLVPTSAASETFKAVVSGLPNTKRCVALKRFVIRVHDPLNDAYKSVSVTVGKRKLHTHRKGTEIVATVDLNDIKGAFKLRISGTTLAGHHFSSTPTYHKCGKGKASSRARGKKAGGKR